MKTIVAASLLLLICILSTDHSQAAKRRKKCYTAYTVNKNGKSSCRKSLKGRYTIEDCCKQNGAQAYGDRKKGERRRGGTNCTPCPDKNVVENWSGWGAWSKCNVQCGKGITRRNRKCLDRNGEGCPGPSLRMSECTNPDVPNCPVHGGWSAWGNWSVCSASCGKGKKLRTRSCSKPTPQYGGRKCEGTRESVGECTLTPHCPINGGWGAWGSWTSCSVTCDIGRRTRARKCDSPKPRYNGEECNPPDAVHKQSCDTYTLCSDEQYSGSGSESGGGSGEMSGDQESSGEDDTAASGSGEFGPSTVMPTNAGQQGSTTASQQGSTTAGQRVSTTAGSTTGEDFDFGQTTAADAQQNGT